MKIRVSLGADQSLGYGHLLICCGKRQSLNIEELEERDAWCCAYCSKPLVVVISGQYYKVGKNISL